MTKTSSRINYKYDYKPNFLKQNLTNNKKFCYDYETNHTLYNTYKKNKFKIFLTDIKYILKQLICSCS